MKRSVIAITGGIGSGKSYVCGLLKERGISIYDCDEAAKRLMRTSAELKAALQRLVGDDVYSGAQLNKAVLAAFLLQSEEHKQQVNAVVHPAVARDFEASGLQWLESAILFDSGFNRRTHFDYIICVTAPLETRLERIMRRDGISQQKALEWIGRQWPQERVAAHSDFIIANDGWQPLRPQIEHILKQIQ